MIKKIIHLSDLHFGTEIPGVTEILIKDCMNLNPDIIIISGDLTQRAKHQQYKTAKDFIDKFKNKIILCTPGNHDISLYNLIERFFYPFSKYKKWISPEICTHYQNENVAILGINSVTPYKPMGGYITDKQLKLVENYFNQVPEHVVKIVVMHHNLIHSERHKIINDSDKILQIYSNAGVNIVLCGHIHSPHVELLRIQSQNKNLYIITAGTAISTRTIEPNSYNVIDLEKDKFILSVRTLMQDKFISEDERAFIF